MAQSVAPGTGGAPSSAAAPDDYVCPMDPDVRSSVPGTCPRCGMKLVVGIPEFLEYPVELRVEPRAPKPGQKLRLSFEVRDPKNGQRVTRFQLVHEKLFHMFILSDDLQFFLHEHPVMGPDSIFRYETTLPKPGMYRILADFYPQDGNPQLSTRTVIVPGATGVIARANLQPDVAPKQASNLEVGITTEPERPVAGLETRILFHLKPADGLEPYLGAWAHMLAASDDLIDLIHDHPFLANGGPKVQFNIIFPRARTYRVWVQFQRKGVVNTVAFNVPVSELK